MSNNTEKTITARPCDDIERQFVEGCRKIWNNDNGWITPTEEYLRNLLVDYIFENTDGESPITPAVAKDHLEEYCDHFQSALDTARDIATKYPKEFSEHMMATTEEAV